MIDDSKIYSLIKKLASLYFEERNIDAIETYLHDKVSWFGPIDEALYIGKEDIKKLLEAERHKNHAKFDICQHQITIEHLDENYILATSEMRVKEKSEYELYDELSLRCSNLLYVKDDQFLIYHIHISIPEIEHVDDESLPTKYSVNATKILKRLVDDKVEEIKKHNKIMDTMSENIPGGMFEVLYDEKLTIMKMSEGFLKMFKYTKEDIEHRYQNSFYAMIDVRDRSRTKLEVKQQLSNGNIKVIEYRVTCKDGSIVWVLDKGQLLTNEQGQKYFSCIMIDISDTKAAEEELRLSMERHKIILDQSNDIIFEWNILSDEVQYSQNWQKLFHCEPITNNVSANLCDISYDSMLHPDDREAMCKLIQDILSGKEYCELQIRLKTQINTYIWCCFKITTIFDDAHNPIKAVGVIFNVDQQVKEAKNLIKMAQVDSLTNTYNRVTAHNKIIKLLEENDIKHACMLIIDLDNFKIVNDTKGHLYGDAVLNEVGMKLRKCFKKDAIVARAGGDEFMVFLTCSLEEALTYIENFSKEIELLSCNKDLTIPVSCSVGISQYAKDGEYYNDLFLKADQALYYAKQKGKNCYALYDATEMANTSETMIHSAISLINKSDDYSDELQQMNQQLGEFVFKMLYKSTDTDKVVSQILELVGKQFKVSRVYIFENDLDDNYCSNTFEWCNDGITPQIDLLQKVSYIYDLDHYEDQFNENGIFYCKDIEELPAITKQILEKQNIKSLLQCAIEDNGKFKGFVGFDECVKKRFWTQEEVNTLKFISEILSTFLMKRKAQVRVQKEVENLMEVLNNLDGYVYVVEPDTFKMRFINRKTLLLDSAIQLEDHCYHSFYKRDSPCEICPLLQLKEQKDGTPLEMYNPFLKLWVSTKPSWITWEKKECILISCFDITKYHQ